MLTPRLQFEALGTKWDIQAEQSVGDALWQELVTAIEQRIDEFDKAYSRFRPDSLVTEIANNPTPGTYSLPEEGYKLLRFYEQLYEVTDGKVTPLIGQTMADAGYDANYSLQPTELHRPPAWEDALSYSRTSLDVMQPVLLDFGAAGKGYLVDIIGELFTQAGIENFYINASGDILHRTAKNATLEVGLENPLDTSEVIGIVRLGNQSLCASSGSKRKWSKYNHIIDPIELKSPQEILATWVLAGDTMSADGLATALFFQKPASLIREFSFTYAILHKDMRFEYAKDFPIQTFASEPA